MRVMRFLVALVICTLPLVSLADTSGQITVVGTGRVELPPDMATITLGVTQEAEDAATAIAAMSEDVAAILAGLTAAGLAAQDIQTQALQLNPVWSNRGSINKTPPAIVGFSASSQIRIRVRDLDALGNVLNDVMALGANGFQSLQFGLQDPQPQTDEARKRAVRDARRKAELYAEAAGVGLGALLAVSEQPMGGPVASRMTTEAMSAELPFAAGAVSVAAQVTLVFALTN